MNKAEAAGNRLIVILNDNDMSIAPPVGGLSHYLARLVSSGKYLTLRSIAQKLARKLPRRGVDAVSARDHRDGRVKSTEGRSRSTRNREWISPTAPRRCGRIAEQA